MYFIFFPASFFMNFILEKYEASIKLKSGNFFTLSSFELIRFIAFLSLFITGNISSVIFLVLLIISIIVSIFNYKYYVSTLDDFDYNDRILYDMCKSSLLTILIINIVITLLFSLTLLSLVIVVPLVLAILSQYIYIGVRGLQIRKYVITYIDYKLLNG